MVQAEMGILYFLQSLHAPVSDMVMKTVTHLGDGGIFWIFLGAALAAFPKTRKMGFSVLLTLALGFLVGNLFLKNLIARERPCWLEPTVQLLIGSPKDFSFPSGHTLASFGAAASIFLYDRKWGSGALFLAALIGLSRLYLFVHFPTDVLAGLVLGVLLALIVHRLSEWWTGEERRAYGRKVTKGKEEGEEDGELKKEIGKI